MEGSDVLDRSSASMVFGDLYASRPTFADPTAHECDKTIDDK